MPKNVVCKKCNNLVNGWCEKVIDSPGPDMQRDCQHFCEKTNADRIRAMSDEELANWLARTQYANMMEAAEIFEAKLPFEEETLKGSEKECLEWLQQPPKEELS